MSAIEDEHKLNYAVPGNINLLASCILTGPRAGLRSFPMAAPRV